MSDTPRCDTTRSELLRSNAPLIEVAQTWGVLAISIERELSAATARAEKLQEELEQANVVLRYATKTKDQYHSERDALEQERDALRNALVTAQNSVRFFACAVKSGERWSMTCQSALEAALASTAKQEPKPRTCGECAKEYWECTTSPGHPSCAKFQPRADAQKGQL